MMINIKEVPTWWPVCSNRDCELRESCLRQHVYEKMATQNVSKWICLMPAAWEGKECTHYVNSEPLHIARGFNQLTARLHNREHRYQIRMAMTQYLGSKGTYYRYKDGERTLSPEQQQWIRNLFIKFGYTDNLEFDEYEEGFQFDV